MCGDACYDNICIVSMLFPCDIHNTDLACPRLSDQQIGLCTPSFWRQLSVTKRMHGVRVQTLISSQSKCQILLAKSSANCGTLHAIALPYQHFKALSLQGSRTIRREGLREKSTPSCTMQGFSTALFQGKYLNLVFICV